MMDNVVVITNITFVDKLRASVVVVAAVFFLFDAADNALVCCAGESRTFVWLLGIWYFER